jgi:hypothetical protein
MAEAADNSRPQIWIELDGQFAQQNSNAAVFGAPFLVSSPFDGGSELDLEKPRSTIWDKGGKITFQSEGSDWALSLGVRYGKISRSETHEGHPTTAGMTKYSGKEYVAYQLLSAQNSEKHFILDFQAGKDVGLGKIGAGGTSVVSAGVRIAQFSSRSHVDIRSQPTNVTNYSNTVNKFHASFAEMRRFNGIGPSLSWDASAAVAGNMPDGEISIDWGVNGAILFGRQKTTSQHQISQRTVNYRHNNIVYLTSNAPVRNKTVTVPNLGGFAGISWRYAKAKVSMGYRADFFFGAIDGGIDTRKTYDRNFYGPYASISIGLGG